MYVSPSFIPKVFVKDLGAGMLFCSFDMAPRPQSYATGRDDLFAGFQ